MKPLRGVRSTRFGDAARAAAQRARSIAASWSALWASCSERIFPPKAKSNELQRLCHPRFSPFPRVFPDVFRRVRRRAAAMGHIRDDGNCHSDISRQARFLLFACAHRGLVSAGRYLMGAQSAPSGARLMFTMLLMSPGWRVPGSRPSPCARFWCVGKERARYLSLHTLLQFFFSLYGRGREEPKAQSPKRLSNPPRGRKGGTPKPRDMSNMSNMRYRVKTGRHSTQYPSTYIETSRPRAQHGDPIPALQSASAIR